MKKLFSLSLVIILIGLFTQGCMDVETKSKPCPEGTVSGQSIENGKTGDHVMKDIVDYNPVSPIKVHYEIDGQSATVEIGQVYVMDGCGGCEIHARMNDDCWTFISGSIWYGTNPDDLTEYPIDPSNFMEFDNGRIGLDFNFPIPDAWNCGDAIYMSLHAVVENQCGLCDEYTASSGTIIQTTQPLTAGQNYDAGNIVVTSDENNFYVTYQTNADWDLEEIHLEIQRSVNDIPHNGGGPINGQFEYKYEFTSPVDAYTVTIPFSDIDPEPECDETFVVAAHATVRGYNQYNGRQETAWGGTEDFPGNNWALYFNFAYNCEYEEEQNEDCIFSAWAFEDEHSFSEYGLEEFGGLYVYLVCSDGD